VEEERVRKGAIETVMEKTGKGKGRYGVPTFSPK